jgi:hypothetical protein
MSRFAPLHVLPRSAIRTREGIEGHEEADNPFEAAMPKTHALATLRARAMSVGLFMRSFSNRKCGTNGEQENGARREKSKKIER